MSLVRMRLSKKYLNHTAGSVIEVDEDRAKVLLSNKVAVVVISDSSEKLEDNVEELESE